MIAPGSAKLWRRSCIPFGGYLPPRPANNVFSSACGWCGTKDKACTKWPRMSKTSTNPHIAFPSNR